MHFDLISVIEWVMTFISGSGGVYLITQLVKKANSISFIQEGQTARIRAAAALLSAIAVVVAHVAMNGSLDVDSVQSVLMRLLEVAAVWGGAHTMHQAVEASQ